MNIDTVIRQPKYLQPVMYAAKIFFGDSYYSIENLSICNECIDTFKVLAEEE